VFAEGDVLVRGVRQELVRRRVKTQGFEHYGLHEWPLLVIAAGSPASDVVPQLLLDFLLEDACVTIKMHGLFDRLFNI